MCKYYGVQLYFYFTVYIAVACSHLLLAVFLEELARVWNTLH